MTPESLVRISGLLTDLVTQGSGAAIVFPGKFQQAVKVWLADTRETIAGRLVSNKDLFTESSPVAARAAT